MNEFENKLLKDNNGKKNGGDAQAKAGANAE